MAVLKCHFFKPALAPYVTLYWLNKRKSTERLIRLNLKIKARPTFYTIGLRQGMSFSATLTSLPESRSINPKALLPKIRNLQNFFKTSERESQT